MLEALQAIVDFVTSDIFQFFTDMFAYLTIKAVTIWIKIKITMVVYFVGVSESILTQLNISQWINDAWAGLDSRVLSGATFFRIPEALNMMISAHVTALVMRFWGVS